MKGFLFVPDITGFSKFVKDNPIDLGADIISELLKVLIENNSLALDISEVEGDAILFYKTGAPVSLQQLKEAFTQMSVAFSKKYSEFKHRYHLTSNLSLKLIVHYGELKVYDLFGFKKLYGQAVVETHKLLKNGIEEHQYVLVTEDYLKALNLNASQVLLSHHTNTLQQHGMSSGIKKVAYYFFPGAKKHLVFQPGNC